MQPELRDQCQHRWDSILASCGVDEKIIQKKHQPCPMCGGKDRFRYTDYQGMGYVICNCCAPEGIDGIDFLQRYLSQSFTDVAEIIRSVLGDTTAKPASNVDLEKLKIRLRATWNDSVPMAKGDPVHKYLINRGLSGVLFSELQNIRTHPALPYWKVDGEKPVMMGKYPAMIGLVTDPMGKPASIHCTYVTDDGQKAEVSPARKMMTPCRKYTGGAIRMGTPKPGQILCIAEGIETALSVKKLHPEYCPWACIDAGNMEKFEAPDNVTVMIAGDNDDNFVGQAAAFQLAKKLSKKNTVEVMIPNDSGTDWNDSLMVTS